MEPDRRWQISEAGDGVCGSGDILEVSAVADGCRLAVLPDSATSWTVITLSSDERRQLAALLGRMAEGETDQGPGHEATAN